MITAEEEALFQRRREVERHRIARHVKKLDIAIEKTRRRFDAQLEKRRWVTGTLHRVGTRIVDDESISRLWDEHAARYVKRDGHTVNLYRLAEECNIAYGALHAWVIRNYPHRVSSAISGGRKSYAAP